MQEPTVQTPERYDGLEIYCGKLGHDVRFSYCRRAGGKLPCSRIIGCWAERVPVQAFLREQFSDQELRRALAPPVPKIQQILEVVARVRRRENLPGGKAPASVPVESAASTPLEPGAAGSATGSGSPAP